MASLKAAIVARYAAVVGATPPLYFQEPPDGATPAGGYAVYLLIEGPTEQTTGDGTTASTEVQFSVFGATAPAVDDAGVLIARAFDPARSRPRLAWDDGYEMTMDPIGAQTVKETRHGRNPDRGAGDSAVWMRTIRYMLHFGGSLGAWDGDVGWSHVAWGSNPWGG